MSNRIRPGGERNDNSKIQSVDTDNAMRDGPNGVSHDAEQPPITDQPLFNGVAADAVSPLLARCEVLPLAKDDVLLEPGQENHNLYLLLDGRLKVHIDRVDSEEGFIIEVGECTGEVSIIDGKPATAFVVAEEPSEVLVLPEAALWQDFFKIPQVTKNFMQMTADRFRARNAAMQQAIEQQLRFEHLQRELEFAREIQAGLLPHQFSLEPEFDIVAEMTPVQQIGGDFYDAFPLGDDEYCVAIGDVAGKGVPAALFMVRTITALRTELLKNQSLEVAISKLNQVICENNPGSMFATLIVGILNRRTGSFRYVDAGHDAVIFGSGGLGFKQLPLLKGLPVGILDTTEYEVQSIDLKSGDVVFLYTDGVTEAMNQDYKLFTLDRLMDCLLAEAASSADELATRVRSSIAQHIDGAPQSDDLTMVIVRRC